MRKAIHLTALLALFAVLALPLAAADVPAAAPHMDAAEAHTAGTATATAAEAQPEVSTDELDALFSDGKVERSCDPQLCNRTCQFVHGLPGDCIGGSCICAF